MGLNQALVVHLRVELCQIRGPIIKRPKRAFLILGGSGENRRFGTPVDENK